MIKKEIGKNSKLNKNNKQETLVNVKIKNTLRIGKTTSASTTPLTPQSVIEHMGKMIQVGNAQDLNTLMQTMMQMMTVMQQRLATTDGKPVVPQPPNPFVPAPSPFAPLPPSFFQHICSRCPTWLHTWHSKWFLLHSALRCPLFPQQLHTMSSMGTPSHAIDKCPLFGTSRAPAFSLVALA